MATASRWLVFANCPAHHLPRIYPGPPLGIVLAIALAHFLEATALGAWRRIGFRQGFAVEAVSLCFIGLFAAQGMVALPSHIYIVPVNAFVLVLLGVIAESVVRALSRLPGAFASSAWTSSPIAQPERRQRPRMK